jgi:multidrug efflux pump subunit AcrB
VFYSFYRRVLGWSLGHKRAVIAMMLILLALSVFGLGHVKKAFFPTSNTPIFYIDIWLPQGTDIRSTLEQVAEIEALVYGQDEVEFVAASIGRGAPRFTATYLPEQSHENFAQLQVRAVKREALEPLMHRLDTEIYRRFPAVLHQLRDMEFGPPARSKIEARFSGPEPGVLRMLGEQAEAVLRADLEARSVYSDWKERGKELVPLVNESEARRLGISNSEISLVLKTAFGGLPVGMYRDGTRNLRIDIESEQNI